MWLFVNNQPCFGYIQITTLNNKNTFGAPYRSTCHQEVLVGAYNVSSRTIRLVVSASQIFSSIIGSWQDFQVPKRPSSILPKQKGL